MRRPTDWVKPSWKDLAPNRGMYLVSLKTLNSSIILDIYDALGHSIIGLPGSVEPFGVSAYVP